MNAHLEDSNRLIISRKNVGVLLCFYFSFLFKNMSNLICFLKWICSFLDAAMGSSSVTGDVRSGFERDVIEVPMVSRDNISDWLLSLGLQRYLGLFVANGFDDVDFLVS